MGAARVRGATPPVASGDGRQDMKASGSLRRVALVGSLAILGLAVTWSAPALGHPVRGHGGPIGGLINLVIGAVFADEIARHEASHSHHDEIWCEEHQQWEPIYDDDPELAEAPIPRDEPLPPVAREPDFDDRPDASARVDEAPVYDEGPPPSGVIVTPPDVLFDPGSSVLSRGAKSRLQRFADVAKQRSDLEIVLRGHTDGSKTESDAFTLSEQRAYVVRSFLVEEGVPWQRVRIVGFGAARPVATSDTAAGRHTRLVGQVRDASHLHGVIHQLMSLAIEIVSITPLGSEPSQPSNKPKEAS